jgi:hypothetical protein
MRKGGKQNITINGKDYGDWAFLGKGRFSICWTRDDEVLSFTNDPQKEAIYLFCTGENRGPHLPDLERIAHDDVRDVDVYKMPRYKALSAKDSEAWRDYKILKEAHNPSWQEHVSKCYGRDGDQRDLTARAYDSIEATLERVRGEVSDSLFEALESLARAVSCYGANWTFEFAPRNLCVNSEGGLLLLDCAFDVEEIARQREAKMRNVRYL